MQNPGIVSSGLPVVVSGVVSTKTALTAAIPSVVTIGIASASAVASNSNRKGLILVNVSANTIYLGLGSSAVLGSGITIYPQGSFEMDEYSFTTGTINAIASAASSNLTVQEFS